MGDYRRITTARLPGGALIGIEQALDEVWYRHYGCPACNGDLRLHRQHKPTGPKPHFEHKERRGPCALMRR